jgi:hypothetical protein
LWCKPPLFHNKLSEFERRYVYKYKDVVNITRFCNKLADLRMKITFTVLWTEAPVSMFFPLLLSKVMVSSPLPLPSPSGHYGVDPNFAIFTRERGGDGGKPENAGFLGIKGSGLGLRENTTCMCRRRKLYVLYMALLISKFIWHGT